MRLEPGAPMYTDGTRRRTRNHDYKPMGRKGREQTLSSAEAQIPRELSSTEYMRRVGLVSLEGVRVWSLGSKVNHRPSSVLG